MLTGPAYGFRFRNPVNFNRRYQIPSSWISSKFCLRSYLRICMRQDLTTGRSSMEFVSRFTNLNLSHYWCIIYLKLLSMVLPGHERRLNSELQSHAEGRRHLHGSRQDSAREYILQLRLTQFRGGNEGTKRNGHLDSLYTLIVIRSRYMVLLSAIAA